MLDLKLIVSAVDRATAPLRRINASIDGVMSRANRVGAAFKAWANRSSFEGVVRRIEGVGGAWENLASRAARATLQIGAGLGAGLFGFKRLFLDTAVAFEKYSVMMRTLEGSQEKAKKSLDWVSDFAMKTPLELDEVMEAFIKLRTFGMDPMNGTLMALVDQNAKLGGSGETLQRIILGVGQAWTKGKLQGEEAMQLLEAGVPVWDLLAKRLHMTTAEIVQLSEKGRLGRKVIIQLVDAMEEASAGASIAQSKTWAGLISNLSDQWARFANKVMDRGVFDALKARLGDILDRVNAMADSGKLDKIATQWAGGFLRIISSVDRLVFGFDKLSARGTKLHMPGLFETLPGRLEQIEKRMQPVVDLFGGWTNTIGLLAAAIVGGPLLAAIGSLTTSIVLLGAASSGLIAKIALLSFGPAVAAIGNLITAVRAGYGAIAAFNLVLAANPIGLVIVGVAALAGAALLIYKNWDFLSEKINGIWQSIKTAFDVGMAYIQPIIDKLMFVARFSPVGLAIEGAAKIGSYMSAGAKGNSAGPSASASSIFPRGGGQPATADLQGHLDIRITSDGAAVVKKVATNNPNLDLNVNSGITTAGAW